MFTDKTRQAICAVAEYCSADMELEDARNSAIVAEVALDADRLTTQGHPEADEEVGKLIDEHGWDAVKAEAAKFVPTA